MPGGGIWILSVASGVVLSRRHQPSVVSPSQALNHRHRSAQDLIAAAVRDTHTHLVEQDDSASGERPGLTGTSGLRESVGMFLERLCQVRSGIQRLEETLSF